MNVAKVVALVLVLVLVPAAPAYAHAGGLTPQDERSTVTAIVPAGLGISAKMVNNSTTLEVRNATTRTVTIGRTEIAPGTTALIRDARTQGARQWRVPVRVGETNATIVGRVDQLPGPPTALWLAALLAIAIGIAAIGRRGHWRIGLAVACLAVAAANITHAVGSALAVTGQPFWSLFLGASGVGLVCWPLAVGTAVAAARKAPSTAFAAAIVGAALVVAGLPDLDSLRFAALPFTWSADLDRLLVVATLGGGLGLAVGGFLAMRLALTPPNT